MFPLTIFRSLNIGAALLMMFRCVSYEEGNIPTFLGSTLEGGRLFLFPENIFLAIKPLIGLLIDKDEMLFLLIS